MRLDHIGIATEDVASFVDLYADLFGFERAHREEFGGMNVSFLAVGDAYLEVLEPVEDGTAIAEYLDRSGPGLHHVAFAVDDVGSALEAAREHGIDLIDESPRPGAWGHEVAFLHPSSTGGVLVEFVAH